MSEQTKNVRSLLGSQPELKGFPGPAAGATQSSCCWTGGNPFLALPPCPFHPPPASKTFRGYSRLRREITSFPSLCSAIFSRKKNAQAHNMTVLRISSYHAAQNPCFSEKLPHNMSFYCDLVIICVGNERAVQARSGIRDMAGGLRQKGRRDVEVFSSAATAG